VATYGKSIAAKVIPGMHHSQPSFDRLVPVPTPVEGASGRLLVVGATGFVGRQVASAAAETGHTAVLASRRPSPGGLACDLLDAGSVRACVEQAAPEMVVNAAGNASVAAGWKEPEAVREVNVAGVGRLLEAVADLAPEAHVLCLSSAQVYGRGPDGRAFAEGDPLEPVTPYGEGKAEMEATAATIARDRGIAVGVARLFNQIGPGQEPSQAAAEFARDIAGAERDGEASVRLTVDHPDSARDFTDVRDAARALLGISAGRLTGTFNVCSGRAVALTSVVEGLAALTELEVTLSAGDGESRPEGATRSFGDPSRLAQATGWRPTIPLERSLADLLEWWRARLAGTPQSAPQ
jgi:GDP-4-dehydro-6-deoxy-D-mannose reductase